MGNGKSGISECAIRSGSGDIGDLLALLSAWDAVPDVAGPGTGRPPGSGPAVIGNDDPPHDAARRTLLSCA